MTAVGRVDFSPLFEGKSVISYSLTRFSFFFVAKPPGVSSAKLSLLNRYMCARSNSPGAWAEVYP